MKKMFRRSILPVPRMVQKLALLGDVLNTPLSGVHKRHHGVKNNVCYSAIYMTSNLLRPRNLIPKVSQPSINSTRIALLIHVLFCPLIQAH